MKEKIIKAAPFLVFIVLLVSTLIAWRFTQDVVKTESRRNFDYEVQIAKHWIQDRLNLYLPIFLGIGSFFETADAVTSSEWETYIRGLKLIDKYPGISSIGYIERVRNEDRDAFISRLRSEKSLDPDYSGFTVHPEVTKEEYYIVKYLEPLKDRRDNLGFDLSSDQKQLEFLNSVRDENPTSAGQVTLITTPKKGFEIILPVYRKGPTLTTVEERREALKGFIQVEFAGDELFQDIFTRVDSINLDFEVYAGSPGEDNLLFDQGQDYSAVNPNYQPELAARETFEFNSQTWYLVVVNKPDFKLTPSQERLPLVVLGSGIVASLIFLGTYLYMRRQIRTTT